MLGIKTLFNYIKELTTDDSGRPSLVKNILFWGFISSTAIMWKLTVMGGMSVEYFGAYLMLVCTQHLSNKYLDNKVAAVAPAEKEVLKG